MNGAQSPETHKSNELKTGEEPQVKVKAFHVWVKEDLTKEVTSGLPLPDLLSHSS